MSKYLFIESREPFESRDAQALYDLAQGQVDEGNEVTVFLIQNGVLSARKDSIYADRLTELVENGVTVLADDFSLRERAVRRVVDRVTPATVEELVEMMLTEGVKTIWH
jgi:sulfur relay protein TusB/DsrH